MHTVEEVMSTDVTTASIIDVIGPLRTRMIEQKIHCIPIVDRDGNVAGIVTSADLVEEWAPQMGVETVMSRDVETVPRHRTVADAARTMIDKGIHHLVVTERDQIVGVVSSFDLLRHLAGRVERIDEFVVPGLHAAVGDIVVVRGAHVGEHDRRAVIVGLEGVGGNPPYLVRWTDDRDERTHLYFPAADAYVEAKVATG